MTFGIITRDGSGNETFRATGRAFRVIYTRDITAGSTGEHPLPGFGPWNSAAFCTINTNNAITHIPPEVSMQSNKVVWGFSNWTPSAFRRGGQLIVVAWA